MNPRHHVRAWLSFLSIVVGSLFVAVGVRGQTAGNEIRLVAGPFVELSTDRGVRWVRIQTNQVVRIGDRLRTGPNSRAALRVSPSTVHWFNELTEIEILPPDGPDMEPGLHLFRGLFFFFHKDKPGRIRIVTPGATAGVDGTEFVIAVDVVNGKELTSLQVTDGKVSFGNGRDTPITLTNGQRAITEIGGGPVRVPGIVANNLLQWAFYYPAVIDPGEIEFSDAERRSLTQSLEAYRSGDLPGALDAFGTRVPGSNAELVYRAALLLAASQVTQTSDLLSQLDQATPNERDRRLAAALRRQIAAVKREHVVATDNPKLASELLAASYYEQSLARGDETLNRALDFAKGAATNSPDFGFAWERIAELEFSFGRTAEAHEALDKSLSLSPKNAQALALEGFLLAAQNKPREAIEWFDRAIQVDAALANAWLGRGLSRIRRGDTAGGQEDLLIATALEPRRAQLRNYLGKAFGDKGDDKRAFHELELAKEADPNDPTTPFYSALIKADQNRINEAINDLEHAQELNGNRSVYRSSLYLDQDRGVRSANLARIYRDAGMLEWSVNEATRAVGYDYANYSAHYFLANSYNDLRDPNLINLRYETPAEAEFLLANLLAPVGAGILSPTISQQEYSKLFERDRFGVISSTEYLSRGAWTESGSQYGTFGNSSYSVEAFYHSDNGQRRKNDVEQRLLSIQLKQQLTPEDTIIFQALHYNGEGRDLTQYYDQKKANTQYRFNEEQAPIVSLGYHHEWSPGVHTLLLAARLDDTLSYYNGLQPSLLVFRPGGNLTSVQEIDFRDHYRANAEIYSSELQQIWQQPGHDTIIGTRVQYGSFETKNLQNHAHEHASQFADPPANQDLSTPFRRLTFYGYHQWQIIESLRLLGGVTYDWMTYPENFRIVPLVDQERKVNALSPKAGFIWTPLSGSTVRFAYTRSLAGASLDQSYQLEPSQIAGFVQSYRSIIPESVAGPNAGARFETFGLSLEQKLPSRTYVSVNGQILNSKVHRDTGVFLSNGARYDNAIPLTLREHLDYEEQSALFTLNQLIGDEWSFGGSYRVSHADLGDDFVDIPDNVRGGFVGFRPRQRMEGVLQQVRLSAIYNHRCGAFGLFEALWYEQRNMHYSPAQPGDEFWQFNVFVGYRFPRRRAEASIGLLNLADQDYKLNPLNVYNEVPRERTLAVRFQVHF